jgi:hypothetical protein
VARVLELGAISSALPSTCVDLTIGKEFAFHERYRLRFNFDAFNVFNHPDF